jgi:hypothetical protein
MIGDFCRHFFLQGMLGAQGAVPAPMEIEEVWTAPKAETGLWKVESRESQCLQVFGRYPLAMESSCRDGEKGSGDGSEMKKAPRGGSHFMFAVGLRV